MTAATALALVLGAALTFAGGAAAKTKHHQLRCRAGYVRRTVRIAARRHGRIVRRNGRIVYVRVQRCVRPIKTKASNPSSPPSKQPTGTTPSSPTVPSPPGPTGPVNTAAPTVSGTTTQGSTLSASPGSWTNSPTGYAYQWQRCTAAGGSCQNVSGNGRSYLLGSSDVGLALRVAVTASNNSGSGSATSAPSAPVGSPMDPVVVAVGDIACGAKGGSCQQSATATLASRFSPSDVFVLGDNQYDNGSLSEYNAPGAYNATWGVFSPIVHPVPGNHEYGTTGAAGYFSYFKQAANPDNNTYGYYSFNVGTWHIVALNSNCSNSDVGTSGCPDALAGSTTSAQTSWLQSDLAANQSPCVLAMWHHPLFSSGWTGGSPGVAPLFSALYNAHADVVLTGHDHLYERYGQLNPSGNAVSNGIREFVVGTGGESLNGLSTIGLQPAAHDDSDFGVLVLTLHASSYSWKFVNLGGVTVDSGTTACNRLGGAPAAVIAAHVARRAQAVRLTGAALAFDVQPLRASLLSMMRSGVPVAVHSSRGVNVTVTIWLRRHGRMRRIASAYETESQISGPYSRISLRLPARWLKHAAGGALVMRFAAVDAAEHRQTLTRTLRLR